MKQNASHAVKNRVFWWADQGAADTTYSSIERGVPLQYNCPVAIYTFPHTSSVKTTVGENNHDCALSFADGRAEHLYWELSKGFVIPDGDLQTAAPGEQADYCRIEEGFCLTRR